ncbi:MAG TPA: hypothetical protein PLQ39_10760, partial [Acinetobacter sp.]|nr:hypothetical protein [Acinetobacter sp.]
RFDYYENGKLKEKASYKKINIAKKTICYVSILQHVIGKIYFCFKLDVSKATKVMSKLPKDRLQRT